MGHDNGGDGRLMSAGGVVRWWWIARVGERMQRCGDDGSGSVVMVRDRGGSVVGEGEERKKCGGRGV